MASLDKSVYILTNGCPENRIDSLRIQEFFRQNGYEISNKIGQANFIIFNSCALFQNRENSSMRIIEEVKKAMMPSAKLIICGCLPKINLERLRLVYSGPVFGSDELDKLDELFNPEIKSEQIYANSLINATGYLSKNKWFIRKLKSDCMVVAIEILEKFREKRDRAFNICRPNMFCIKICSGCLGNCSFCAVRLSRGKLKSKPFEMVIKEFEEGLKKGYKEFALLGTEVGAYGKDLGIDLVILLKKLISREGDYKISLRNLHPRHLIEMLPGLSKIFASGKIFIVACSPESGNNRILELMNRGYKIEDFKQAIGILNKDFPQIKIRSQFIVGFPTETEEEFQDSLRLVDELCFDFVEVYMFQASQRIKAATMVGQVPGKIKLRRNLRFISKLVWEKC